MSAVNGSPGDRISLAGLYPPSCQPANELVICETDATQRQQPESHGGCSLVCVCVRVCTIQLYLTFPLHFHLLRTHLYNPLAQSPRLPNSRAHSLIKPSAGTTSPHWLTSCGDLCLPPPCGSYPGDLIPRSLCDRSLIQKGPGAETKPHC